MTNNEFQNNKKFVPVKNHIKNIEVILFYITQDNLTEIKKELNYNRKKEQNLRTEISTLEYRTKEKLNEILKLITDDMSALDRDIKKVQQNDRTETEYFKTQVNMLISDKSKLQQNYTNLDNRLIQCESDVGVSNKQNKNE